MRNILKKYRSRFRCILFVFLEYIIIIVCERKEKEEMKVETERQSKIETLSFDLH